jgi:hypothetical protein
MVLVDPLFAPGDLSEAKRARCPMRNTLLAEIRADLQGQIKVISAQMQTKS